MEIIFHSRWLACKINRPHQCCGRILVECGTTTPQWLSETVQACHCKLGQSSVCHNCNNKTKPAQQHHGQLIPIIVTTTMFTPAFHSACPCFPMIVSLFLQCGIITMAVPHCALTIFQFFTQISPCPSLLHTSACTSVALQWWKVAPRS